MIINKTPHAVNVTKNGEVVITFAKSENPARCTVKRVKIGSIEGIPLYKTEFGEIKGLLDPEEGVFYIVSRVIAEAMKGERKDLLVPDDTVRNGKGVIIGCTGFTRVL